MPLAHSWSCSHSTVSSGSEQWGMQRSVWKKILKFTNISQCVSIHITKGKNNIVLCMPVKKGSHILVVLALGNPLETD